MLELYKIITINVRRSTNMANIKSDVSNKETSHECERKLIHMNKVHEVSEINTCHRKVSYDNIVRGS